MAMSRRKNPPRRSLETGKVVSDFRFNDFMILWLFALGRVILLSRKKEHRLGGQVGLLEFCLVFPCVGVSKDTSQRVWEVSTRDMSLRNTRSGEVGEMVEVLRFYYFMTFSFECVIYLSQKKINRCGDEVGLSGFCLVLPFVGVYNDNFQRV